MFQILVLVPVLYYYYAKLEINKSKSLAMQ